MYFLLINSQQLKWCHWWPSLESQLAIDFGVLEAVEPVRDLFAERVRQVIFNSFELLESIAVASKLLVISEDGAVADHGEHLKGLEEVKINRGWVVSNQELLRTQELNKSWEVLVVFLDSHVPVILSVAERHDLPSDLSNLRVQHAHHRLVLRGLPKQGAVPDLGNIVVNCQCFCDLVLSVDEVGDVRELQTQLDLVSLEPVIHPVVKLLVEINSTVLQLVPDVRGESSNSPVTQNRLARNMNPSVSHKLGLDVVEREGSLVLEISDVSWEDASLEHLLEVLILLILRQILSLVVLVLDAGQLQIYSLALL